MKAFFKLCPTPKSVNSKAVKKMVELLSPFGLQHVRSAEIQRVAALLKREKKPTRAQLDDIKGVGKYVSDAYALIYLKDFSIQPDDYALELWKEEHGTHHR
jgi:endonuclease III